MSIKNISKSEPRVVTNFANAESGDLVIFGHYEQDNDTTNGAEPIEWLVLSNNGSELFLLSKYALDSKEFHNDLVASWETCSLRTWLNEDFYNIAFSDEEKKIVKTTSIKNEDNTKYGIDGGNNTKDKVFLLSESDINNPSYGLKGPQDENSKCIATAYASVQAKGDNYYGTSVAYGPCLWWLRTIGCADECSACVASNGILVLEGDVHIFRNGVRPALRVEITGTKDEEKGADNNSSTDKDKNVIVEVGKIITFGSYEQDNDLTNGAEPIEWSVLSIEGDKALLLSKNALDCKPYNDTYASWDKCSIRNFLNDEFYNKAFNDNEKNLIKDSVIKEFDIYSNAKELATDKIFLLPLSETNNKKYVFESDESRMCVASAYTTSQGVAIIKDYKNEEGKYPCLWYVQNDLQGITDFAIIFGGEVRFFNNDVGGVGVRPALYLDVKNYKNFKLGKQNFKVG